MLRIRQARLQRKWNQTALAARAGLSTSIVSLIERGRLQPYPIQIKRLAKALNVAPDELLKPVADTSAP